MQMELVIRAREAYQTQGHAVLEKLIDDEVASRIVAQFITVSPEYGRNVGVGPNNRTAVRGSAVQVYGNRSPVLAAFHWGLTPIMSAITGLDLVPSYSMFRAYSRGSTLLVHRDREASEHGLSLTLGCSDGIAWPLEIAAEGEEGLFEPVDQWGGIPHRSYPMRGGDALLYRGSILAHARTTPNPNASSVHGFMFWVDANGPHADLRYERGGQPE